MKFQTSLSAVTALGLGAVLLTGCATSGVRNPSATGVTEMRGDEKGFVGGTGVESQDLIRVSDKIARGILGAPQIANAATPPVVVLDPVLNETRFPINKNIFLDRIQAQLISKAAGKVTFLARERMETLQRERDAKRGQRDQFLRRERAGVQGRGLFPHWQTFRPQHVEQERRQRLHPLHLSAH
jgi:hypothetical protein